LGKYYSDILLHNILVTFLV